MSQNPSPVNNNNNYQQNLLNEQVARQAQAQQADVQAQLSSQLQIQQNKVVMAQALLDELQKKINDIDKQIIEIKKQYYDQINLILSRPGELAGIAAGRADIFLQDTNRKIDMLVLQKQSIGIEYQEKLNQLR